MTNNSEIEQKMLAKVDSALERARKAAAEYEVSAMLIQQRVSRTTINVSSQSSLNDLRDIVRSCASACDKLYLAYQNLIHELDSELRGFLTQKPGAYAIKAVAGAIAWLNEESRIQNNYAAQFDGLDLGQLVKAKYLPRPESLDTERYWKAQYNALPDKGEAEARWSEKLREHKRLASEEERKATDNRRKVERETRDLIKSLREDEKKEVDREMEKKKKEFQSQYSMIRERMEYCRPAADLLFFRNFNYGYVMPDGTARINYDENHIGCVVRRMHDLRQIVCLSEGVVGLDTDGRIQLSNIDADRQKEYGLDACRKWRNVKKLAACPVSNQVIGLLEDGHCVATTPRHDYGVQRVSAWTEIMDVVCEQYFAAGLRKDGTVVISGTGNIPDELRKSFSGQKGILAIFAYDTWRFAALKEDGTILPNIAELKEPAIAAKNIVAIAKSSDGPVFLQADGTVVATKSRTGGWGGQKTEGYLIDSLKNVVAVYTGPFEFGALCEDGVFRSYSTNGDSSYELNKGAPIFRSYREYVREIKEKAREKQERLEKIQQEEQLRADRRAKGLCQHCGGELEKKLFGWKCKACGKKKDYSLPGSHEEEEARLEREKAEEERRKQEERRKAEEERKAEETRRQEEERRKAEEARRLEEERRKAEEARRKSEETRRQEEERRKAEEARRQEEERRKAEAAAVKQEAAAREAQRQSDAPVVKGNAGVSKTVLLLAIALTLVTGILIGVLISHAMRGTREKGNPAGMAQQTATGESSNKAEDGKTTEKPELDLQSVVQKDAAAASDFVYVSNGSEIQINGYKGTASDLVIPDEIDGQPVTRIGPQAFSNCETIRAVQLPSQLVEIGDMAFGYLDLEGILILPSTLEIVGGHAFASNKLTGLVIQSSCKLEVNAFANLSELEFIYVTEGSNPDIGTAVFSYAKACTVALLPESMNSIKDETFNACTQLVIYTKPGSFAEEYARRNFIQCNTDLYDDVLSELMRVYG